MSWLDMSWQNVLSWHVLSCLDMSWQSCLDKNSYPHRYWPGITKSWSGYYLHCTGRMTYSVKLCLIGLTERRMEFGTKLSNRLDQLRFHHHSHRHHHRRRHRHLHRRHLIKIWQSIRAFCMVILMFINNTLWLYHQREVLQARSWSITNERSSKLAPDPINERSFEWGPDLTNVRSFKQDPAWSFTNVRSFKWGPDRSPTWGLPSVVLIDHQREVFQVRSWSITNVRSFKLGPDLTNGRSFKWSPDLTKVRSFKWGPDRPTSLLCSRCNSND